MFLTKAEPLDKFFRDYFGVGTFRGAKKHLFIFFSWLICLKKNLNFAFPVVEMAIMCKKTVGMLGE